ncbi:MAG: hypothetical protein FWD94_00280 [Treponema sp.]|nr:hypothetical protein [Treponema sp.]
MRRTPILVLTVALLVPLFTVACGTGNLTIPEGLSPAELIQKAQEASDRNRHGEALQYYRALLERNGDVPELVVNAEYEIAFIHYKRRNFAEARAEMRALLERYDASDGGELPEKFRILAEIVLARMEDTE